MPFFSILLPGVALHVHTLVIIQIHRIQVLHTQSRNDSVDKNWNKTTDVSLQGYTTRLVKAY
jgi:hypothetical protein